MAQLRKASRRCIPSPPPNVWHGYHASKSIRNVALAAIGSFITTTTLYICNSRWRINKYTEFYDTYDAEKSFARMRDAGLLQSCPSEK